MAYKAFATGDNLTVKIWTDQVDLRFRHGTTYKDGRDVSSSPGEAPICQKNELESYKQRGDRIRMQGVDEFDGEGAVGDETITGKGEAIRTSWVDVIIDQIRHETESDGVMSDKRTTINFRKIARDRLTRWIRRKIDALRLIQMSGEIGVGAFLRVRWRTAQFNRFLGATLTPPDSDHRLYANDATSVGTLDSTDLPTYALCAKIKRFISDMDNPPMPIDVEGQDTYVIYLDESTLQMLKKDTQFRETFLHGAPRSNDHPLIKGSFAYADGLALRVIPQLIKPDGASTAGAVRRMLVVGADHLYEAWAKGKNTSDGRFSWREEEGDRGTKDSVTVGTLYGNIVNTWTEDDGVTRKWRNALTVDYWAGTAA